MSDPKTEKRGKRWSWATGKCLRRCHTCGVMFQGGKRATCCADCAHTEGEEVEAVKDACTWTTLSIGASASSHDTECGRYILCEWVSPTEKGYDYCPYCGKRIILEKGKAKK